MKRLTFIFLFIAIVALIIPGISSAEWINLNLDYPRFGNIELDCNNGITLDDKRAGVQCGQDLTSLIAWLYYGIIMLSGLAAFVMIVWGGIQYLTSSGDPGKTGDATDRMKKALLGLLIILSSWLILQTINPELTILEMPDARDAQTQAPEAPLTLSSGSPTQQCAGSESYEESTAQSLEDAAEAIYIAFGRTPSEWRIELYLIDVAGSESCREEDVAAILAILESAHGSAPGGSADGIVIDTTTAYPFCRPTNVAFVSGVRGAIFDPIGIPGATTINTTETILRTDVETNVSALINYCNGRESGYCTWADGERLVADFTSGQKTALIKYCCDIIPPRRMGTIPGGCVDEGD